MVSLSQQQKPKAEPTIQREISQEERDLIGALGLTPVANALDGAYERKNFKGRYYPQRDINGLASVWYSGETKPDGTKIPPQTFKPVWNGTRFENRWVADDGNSRPFNPALLLPEAQRNALFKRYKDEELKIINELELFDTLEMRGGKPVRAADGSFSRAGYEGRYYLQRGPEGVSIWYSGVRNQAGAQVGSCTYSNGTWSRMDWAPKSDVLLREYFASTASLVLPDRAGHRA